MKLTSYRLSEEELLLVKVCMEAACVEIFFPDWEFMTLFGIERDELRHAIKIFADLDLANPIHKAAVKGSMGHLLGYPHGRDKDLEKMIGCEVISIKKVLDKLNEN